MSENIESVTQEVNTKRIAFILNNTVIDILNTNEALATTLLGQPIIVDITSTGENSIAEIGYGYDEINKIFISNKPESFNSL
jgi:hypothetical protein